MTTTKHATVFVRLKEGVLDPQGVTIQKALEKLGYSDVLSVRSGKFYELEVQSDGDINARVEELSARLLANPVIESFEVMSGS